MPVVALRGVQLHVQLIGDAGPPVVMMHGFFPGTLALWYFGIAPALAKDHRVVLFDWRGHGLSEVTPDGYGLSSLIRDLDAVLDQYTTEPVALVGYSLGAAAAVRYAAWKPERVTDLAVFDPPMSVAPPERDDRSTIEAAAAALAGTDHDFQRRVVTSNRRLHRLLAHAELLRETTSMRADLERDGALPDAEQLAGVTARTLLCYPTDGGFDATREYLAAHLPHSETVILPGDHFFVSTAAPAVRDLLCDFLHG